MTVINASELVNSFDMLRHVKTDHNLISLLQIFGRLILDFTFSNIRLPGSTVMKYFINVGNNKSYRSKRIVLEDTFL